MPVKILLVEDDELFRLGLRVRLQQEPELEVTAEASDGETALELLSEQRFDVVLLDVGLPGIGGLEACHQIKQHYPKLPILVLTSHAQPALLAQLVEAGAQGYCLKGIAAEWLILALRSVAIGASWWDETATQAIRNSFSQSSLSINSDELIESIYSLTHREQEILALIASGKSNPDIAKGLYITPGTVRVHVHAILNKLNVRDRTQAAIIALKNKDLLEQLIHKTSGKETII